MENFLDSIIGFFSPSAGIKRLQTRNLYGTLKRKYEGASRGRRTEGWYATSGSVNTEMNGAINVLRDRSRDLIRNNPYAENVIEILTTNLVGTGIVPTPISTANKKMDKIIRSEWTNWADSLSADFYGKTSFYGLQDLSVRTVFGSGECFIRKRYVTDRRFPIQLQLLEGDFLDTTKDIVNYDNGGYIRRGIEFDAEDRVKAYWLYKYHPAEHLQLSSVRVPASEIIHIHELLRPGQQGGVPRLSNSIQRLRDLDDFEDAELVRQKIAACFTSFITSTGININQSTSDYEPLERLEPAYIHKLLPGESISFANPPTKEGYSEYVTKNLRAISAGGHLTYEALSKDYSTVNFSSARMGWLEFNRSVQKWQWLMIVPQCLNPIWTWFIEGLVLLGKIPPSFSSPGVNWTVPRREMISPVEETKALNDDVRSGFKSWSEAVRERGYNPEDIIQEMIADAAMFDKSGLKPASDPRYDPNRSVQQPGEQKQGIIDEKL